MDYGTWSGVFLSGCPGWGLGNTGWNFFQNLGSGCPGWGLGYTGWNFFQNLGSGWCQGGLKGLPSCVHLNRRHSSPANQAKSLASLISVSGLPLAGPVSFVATAMPRTQSASISLRAVGGEHRSALATSLVVRMPPLSINVRKTFARIVGALPKAATGANPFREVAGFQLTHRGWF